MMDYEAYKSSQRLRDLIDEEEEAWQQAAAAEEGDSKERTTKVRAWWAASDRVIQEYLRLSRTGTHPCLPTSAIMRLSKVARILATGNMPQPVRDAIARGKGPMSPDERKDIAYAGFYIRAAKAGDIIDHAPIKRVSECYGVFKQTVQGWVKQADELSKDIAEPSIEVLTNKMHLAGANYSRNKRGIGLYHYVDTPRSVPSAAVDALHLKNKEAMTLEESADLDEILRRRDEMLRRRVHKAKADKERQRRASLLVGIAAAWDQANSEDSPDA